MQWTTLLAVPLLVVAGWLYTAYMSSTFPTLRNKRICLLIAHPDDEAMFFAPMVLALTKEGLGNHLKILCLSSGNADGLGETRKRELVKSGMQLGLRKEDDVFVIEDTNFQDSMTATWDAKLISNVLSLAFAPNLSKASTAAAPPATIDVLITFDRHGVSGHPNHISLYHGAREFLKSLMRRHPGWDCPVALYTLKSVSLARKYASILEAPVTILQCLFRKKQTGATPSPLLFVSSMPAYRTAQTAMTTAHKSQMAWFRWGWIALSRYMVIDDLTFEKVI
ncbi:MAG: hypothetical protein M1819_000352 [Sarea resinae]|nr:MAG: hypothetical protein M1819_000352 [Sarea resinae]